MARVGDELQVFVGPGAAHAEARPEAGKRCVSVFQRLAAGRGWYTRMDRLASRSFKDLNSGALRRKPTVMPDSTLSPGNPGVPRDTDRRASEQGAGAPRRTPPGAPAASGLVRSRAPRPGAVGRAERVEPRWRDIQWIDFTSESDSEETPAPESNRVPAGSTTAEPAPRVAPELSKPLHHLGATAVKPRRATNDAIPGLVSRFVRLPVPRFPAATARNPVETMARRLEPRLAFPVAKIAPLPCGCRSRHPNRGTASRQSTILQC
jgi:hypothetical protein